jgi:GNAT superfamily N-acetyltransferase
MQGIREAQLGDAQDIAEIIVGAWQHAYEGIVDPRFPPSLRTETFVSIMEKNLREKREQIFVYESPVGRVEGFISGREGDDIKTDNPGYDAEIVGLYVRPDAQGRGIGTKLFKELTACFRGGGRSRMIAWTLLGAKNNSFYVKQGGVARERKRIEIGGRSYPGVGFSFEL